jgi:hypothetical protein
MSYILLFVNSRINFPNVIKEIIVKRTWALVLAAAILASGCILDNSGDKKDSTEGPKVIGDLTMGGGVFYIESEGYALAEFGTFHGTDPYEGARVFVNGIEMHGSMGIFSNAAPIPTSAVANGNPVHIAIYALGDSVVHDIALPQTPSLVNPAANATLTAGQQMTVQINYPGSHQFISMALTNQDNVALAVETQEQQLTVTVPGSKLPNAGACTLTAIASNASGPIPSNFDINNQYVLFTVSAMTLRQVTFVR